MNWVNHFVLYSKLLHLLNNPFQCNVYIVPHCIDFVYGLPPVSLCLAVGSLPSNYKLCFVLT